MTSVDLSNVSNKKKPTEEQKDILREKGNRVVIAVPGSGKTYTLSLIIKEILCDSPNYKGVIAISYTNKASDELKDRSLSGGLDPKSSYFGTIDSFYYSEIIKPFLPRLWGRNQSEVQITDFKNTQLIESTDLESLKKIHNGIYQLNENTLAIIKKYYYKGFIFIELLGKLGLFTLEHSSSLQKYLKARYTHIIVDEYQDSGDEQHQLFISLVRFSLIGIAVGDVDQSIFRWAGKNPQYLIDLSKDKKSFNSFILTLNHRCHPSIVNYSMRLLAPNIEIIDNKEKRVFHWKIIGNQEDIAKKIGELIPQIKQKYAIENNNQIGILVRNDYTGSKIDQYLTINHKYIRNTVLDNDSNIWSRAFIDLLFYTFDKKQTTQNFLDKWTLYDLSRKNKILVVKSLIKLRNLDSKDLSSNINIFEEIVNILLPNNKSLTALNLLKNVLEDEASVNSYFPINNDEIQIMSIHKSKGLEFDIVFHLDLHNYVIPSSGAMKGDKVIEKEDMNLHYVGITRAKKVCILVSSTKNHLKYKGEWVLWDAQPSNFLSINNLQELRG